MYDTAVVHSRLSINIAEQMNEWILQTLGDQMIPRIQISTSTNYSDLLGKAHNITWAGDKSFL